MQEGLLLAISHILTNAPYFALAYIMFRRQRRLSSKNTALILSAFVLAHGASSFLLTVAYGSDANWPPVQFAIFCAGLIALLLLLYRISFFRALYAFMLIRALYTAVLYIVLNIFMLANPGEYIGFDQTPLYTLAAVLANCAVFPFLYKFVTGRLWTSFLELDDKTIRQLCIPPALFFLLDQCYSSIRDTLEYDSFQTAMIFLLLLGAGLATYYVNLRMVTESREQMRRASESEKQLALQAQRYGQLTDTIERTREAHHDLRHHLSVIMSFIKKDNIMGLESYLAEYIGSIPDESFGRYCENHAVDAVAQYYLTPASAAGVEVDIRLQIPQEAGLPDSDLCIIFGNIIENAVKSCLGADGDDVAEATQKQDTQCFIRARGGVAGGRLIFTLDNSGCLNPGRAAKYDGAGIGLQSVRTVADKYNGTLDFRCEGGIYKTSLMLMLPQ